MWPTIFDVPTLKVRAEELEAQQKEPDFWSNQEKASAVSKELSDLREEIDFADQTQTTLAEQRELLELAEKEEEHALLKDIERALQDTATMLDQKEKLLRFTGTYDKHDAIITIQAGAGGTDAQDWAQMLERMYLRSAEQRGWATTSIHRSAGEEAGIKSTTFEVKGKYAYGILKEEQGVHRLVRQSPFNANSLRQTSFARVEAVPRLPENEAPEIDPTDLEVQTFRAGGAGGQHVNKTSSAVRIRHIPTNIVVSCQTQRSQGQNKAYALSMLAAKLQLLVEEQHVNKVKELRGEIKEAAWGNQIRSYVLHPYKLVKDHRTNIEEKDVEGVLDGNLSAFLGK